MGHETFYNSLLVAMGNVVSALLMYALQAAWLCQRLIDQDYRQNHGSRLKPVLDSRTSLEPVEITPDERTTNHKRHNPKPRKLETTELHGESPRRRGESKRRKHGHRERSRAGTNAFERGFNRSHPYLEGSDAVTTTVEYVNRLGSNVALRRAFSDINLSSGCSEFRCFDNNQNYVDERTLSVTDQDFVRLIFNKGYVT